MRPIRVCLMVALCAACGSSDRPRVTDAAIEASSDAALPADHDADGDPTCTPGTRGCECASGLCREGLQCEANICQTDPQTDAGNPRDGYSGAACGDTSADPNNCGTCGRVCESGTCESGECGNAWSACFTEGDAFTTCEQVCGSHGKSCVAAGCDGGMTLRAWGGASSMECQLNVSPRTWDERGCDETLTWGDSSSYKRCCCTD